VHSDGGVPARISQELDRQEEPVHLFQKKKRSGQWLHERNIYNPYPEPTTLYHIFYAYNGLAIYLDPSIQIYLSAYLYSYSDTYTYTPRYRLHAPYLSLYMHTDICLYISISISIYAYIYICTRICLYIYIYIYIYR